MEEIITLDYGSGGTKTSELIESLLLPVFDNQALNVLGDGAVLDGNEKLVFSTDSFVVSPWRFPGGNIGKLCVCGTVNDIAMAGGMAKYLSLSFILEEGFLVSDLKEIIASIAREAKKAGVIIATGDTKVVERGKGDGIYINTSGIGVLRAPGLGKDRIRPGDAVILSGSAGRHGASIMMARTGLLKQDQDPHDIEGQDQSLPSLNSDCQILTELAGAALSSGQVRILRDPTRGGVATTLNEFVEGTDLTIELDESEIPVDSDVAAVCDLLGLDPLYCACEGRMLAVCAPEAAGNIAEALRKLPGGEGAACIGKVTSSRPGKVILKTALGGARLLGKLAGQQLPRIC